MHLCDEREPPDVQTAGANPVAPPALRSRKRGGANNHHSVPERKRAHIVLWSGEEIIGKFLRKGSRFMLIEGEAGVIKIANRDIKSVQLAKHLHKPAPVKTGN